MADMTKGASQVITLESYVGQPEDFTSIAKSADIVVEGVVEELLPTRWTTPNGKAPAVLTDDPHQQIRTPVRLSVTRVFKGDPVGKMITFSFLGGRVDDIAMVTERHHEVYQPGNKIILFLYRTNPGSAPSMVDAGGLTPSMPLMIQGDVAHGPLYDVPLADLEQQIVRGLQ
jgi:hypothetical protein